MCIMMIKYIVNITILYHKCLRLVDYNYGVKKRELFYSRITYTYTPCQFTRTVKLLLLCTYARTRKRRWQRAHLYPIPQRCRVYIKFVVKALYCHCCRRFQSTCWTCTSPSSVEAFSRKISILHHGN